MEASGLTSQENRKKIKDPKEKTLTCYKNIMNAMVTWILWPRWWEIRLFTKCNLSCIMCTPGLSSMMYKEYPKWEKQGKIIPMMKGALDIAKESGEEYLKQ